VTAKVLFLNKHLAPSEEEIRENERIQEKLTQIKIEFEFRIRDLNPYQKSMSRERAHNLMRDRMKIVSKKLDD
jgi:hypothetical protein